MTRRQTITKSALRDLPSGIGPSSYPINENKENTIRKTVFITGATSGFGAAMARRFAKAGCRVVATGRRAERLRALVDEFGPETIAAAAFDMRDVAAMNATVSALPELFRGIDVLINNAGLALGTAPAPETRLDDWLRMIETNITGLVTLTHRLLPILIERKGLIVNLSSVAGSYPYPGGNVYGATKAFVRQKSC
jgi:serine 3-dehydrogenase